MPHYPFTHQGLAITRHALRFGNETMGLSAASQRIDQSRAPAVATSEEYSSEAAALHDGDAVVFRLLHHARELVLVANSSSPQAVPTVGADPAALGADNLVSSMSQLEQQDVSPLLRRSSDLFHTCVTSSVATAATADFIVSGVNVAVTVALYMFVTRIAVRALLHESRRTQVSRRERERERVGGRCGSREVGSYSHAHTH